MWIASKNVNKRLKELEFHLRNENPLLVSIVKSFQKLDRVGYATGLLDRDESYANHISWWPLISVLGTFSAGKSTFINHFLGMKLQDTGNQAVDDKFTVICYKEEEQPKVLPGIALDADPRFPFYQISKDLEEVAPGEGERVDSYLQLKTCPSEVMRGRILIDSPGYDADAQRQSILRSTEHIINLSDLVLVFFDARHPEPGAMRETLDQLVGKTIHRQDAVKFMYILNQIDTAAREDNSEEVVASWQRALSQQGLTAGKFYCIYNPEVAVEIDDEERRIRYERKRDEDLSAIHERIKNVSTERAYRIVSLLDKTASDIEQQSIPRLREALFKWRNRVLWQDGVMYSLILALFLYISISLGYWDGLRFAPPWLENIEDLRWIFLLVIVVGLGLSYLHYLSRKLAAGSVIRWIAEKFGEDDSRSLIKAFTRNTRAWRSVFSEHPAGWGRRTRKRLHEVIDEADRFVQKLNDNFTNPSGEK